MQPYENAEAPVAARMQSLRPLIAKYGAKYDVPPSAIAAFVQQESGGYMGAVNPDGGSGLLQMTPPWHRFDRGRMLTDAEYALDLGVAFIKSCLDNHSGDLFAAAGQFGPHHADGSPHPPYQRAIVALRQHYADWDGGATEGTGAAGGTAGGVTGATVLAEAVRWLGTTDRGQYDPSNGHGAVFGWCQAFVESCHERCGLRRVRYPDALAFLNDPAIPTRPLPAPAGACVLFGRNVDPAGHVTIADGQGNMIGTTTRGIVREPIWAGAAGWQWYPGVRADVLPSAPTDGHYIEGNPYGHIAVEPLFWDRWSRLHADGLALPTLGYVTESVITLPTGRKMQRFERAMLATGGSDAPWNVVSLLLAELPAPNAAPGAAPVARLMTVPTEKDIALTPARR